MKRYENKSGESLKVRALRLLDGASADLNEDALTVGKSVDEILEDIRLYHAELEIQNNELESALQNIEQQKHHYQRLFNTSPFPMIVFDKHGVIDELNEAAMVHLKLHYPTQRKKSLYQMLSPDSGTTLSALLTGISDTVQTQEVELEFKRPKTTQFECVLTLYSDEDKSPYLLIMRDITSLKQLTLQNELLLKAVSATTAGIVITDPQRRVIWCNPAFNRISGYSLEDVKGHSLKGFLQGEKTDPETSLKLKNALDGLETIDIEILNYHKNGKVYWNNLVISPILEGNELRYFIGIQHDITEKKALLDAKIKMQHWDTIGQITAGISHDFNNILGIISGYQELIASINTQPELASHLDKLKSGIDRASSLVSKLLKSSQMSQEGGPLGSLKEAIEDTQSLVAEFFKSSNRVQWSVEAGLDQLVSTTDLQDVLLNLIINARNASADDNDIRVKVQYQSQFNDDKHFAVIEPTYAENYIMISVSDGGCGIAKDKFLSIFEPFNSQSKQQGSGLGLATVLAFTKQHSYGLTIKSTLGVGTILSLWMPHMPCPPDRLDTLSKEQIVMKDSLRIAVVDDEADIADITQKLLELCGHRVTIFNAPEVLLESIDDVLKSFDLLITDELMPGKVKGHNLLKALDNRLPAILMSGYSESKDVEPYKNLILHKPFTRNQLEEKVTEVMSNFKLK
ncbi:hybrid sensor histidine kinase/response regulator [Alteromonas sediminis]|uniref:hybrid sensor histidine kinase/response regulator n=1 Tax=Alteromonas sediminis TaxID=2259342 RepID=UPI0010589382|nr:PAS domain-containing protein [Alteromonas sediminis]